MAGGMRHMTAQEAADDVLLGAKLADGHGLNGPLGRANKTNFSVSLRKKENKKDNQKQTKKDKKQKTKQRQKTNKDKRQ